MYRAKGQGDGWVILGALNDVGCVLGMHLFMPAFEMYLALKQEALQNFTHKYMH